MLTIKTYKMKNILVLLVTVIFTMMSCTPAEKPLTADEKSGIESTISNLLDTIVKESLALDYDRVLSHVQLDDNLSFVIDGEIIIGGEKYKSLVEGIEGSVKGYTNYELPERYILVLDRNFAMVIVKFDESFITATDDTIRSMGVSNMLFKLVDGSWKAVHSSSMHKSEE
jgi:ketosteroid isomerase-like protein